MTYDSHQGRHRTEHDRRKSMRARRARWAAGFVSLAAASGALFAVPALAAGPVQPAAVEQGPVAAGAHREPVIAGTPCSASSRACVDLESQRAWLIRDGRVARGPMTIASGGDGQETPIGHSFRVYRKDKDHVSGESRTPDGRPAPMPFSTFFADGGIAFHGGDPARSSAGCIRMELPDAQAMFADLQNGDKVQVVNASQESAARR